MKRVILLLPILVGLGILAGFLLEQQRSGGGLPSFTPAQPPKFGALVAPTGSASLVGRLLAPGGDPVADASIYVRSGEVPAWTYTDRDGAFLLEGLQAQPATALVMAWGFPPTKFEVLPGGEALSLTLPPRSDRVPGLPDIERADLIGRVLHPLGLERGYELVLLPDDAPHLLQGPVRVRTRTDADGRFRIDDVAVGRYKAQVLPLWAQGGSWPDLTAEPDAILDHSAQTEPVDLHLAAGALSGRLRDPEGRPIEGALVLLSRADDPAHVWPPALSGPTGEFELNDLPPDDYLLEIRAGEGLLTDDPVRIEAGQRLELSLRTLRIREDRALPTGE